MSLGTGTSSTHPIHREHGPALRGHRCEFLEAGTEWFKVMRTSVWMGNNGTLAATGVVDAVRNRTVGANMAAGG